MATLILALAGRALADGPTDFRAAEAARSGRALKISGGVLTGVGALAVTAAVVLAVITPMDAAVRERDAQAQMGGAAFYMGIAGGATLAAGIPMLAVGAAREKRARVHVAIAPNGVVGRF